jgi:uncharacterized protein (TIGR02145 family)
MTNITIATTGATGIGTATGLPAGVTASWSADVITISGTPTTTGTFNYTIPLTGGCGSVNATGSLTVSACPTATITDNGMNTYNTVTIGTQCWMKENLRVREYNDGTEIRFDASGGVLGTTSQTWSGMGLEYGAYTLYAHDSMATPSNLISYGYLYNWYAASGISSSGNKNICPSGWHVPSNSDWNKLVKFIDPSADTTTASVPLIQSSTAGGKLKSTSNLWNTSSPSSSGTDNYGFSALPGGSRFLGGSFGNVSYYAFFWSTTEIDVNFARNRHLIKDNNVFEMCGGPSLNHKSNGASVRCLKD